MQRSIKLCIILFSFLFVSHIIIGQNAEIPTKKRSELIEITGTVKEVNKETREITVMGDEGELQTFTASEDMERFATIDVGDVISLDIYSYLEAEFRKPTEAELAEPLEVVTESDDKTGLDMEPRAAIGAVIKAVVTIQVINLPSMYVTIKGPKGNFTTIDLEDEELIKQLHVGQVLILTYGEAIGISLTKAED